jgi:hypothetical protein
MVPPMGRRVLSTHPCAAGQSLKRLHVANSGCPRPGPSPAGQGIAVVVVGVVVRAPAEQPVGVVVGRVLGSGDAVYFFDQMAVVQTGKIRWAKKRRAQ